jgi:hypothetical protein
MYAIYYLIFFQNFVKAPAHTCSQVAPSLGVEDSKIIEGGRLLSIWWKDLRIIKEGVDLSVGRWFDDNIKREEGNRENTFFF